MPSESETIKRLNEEHQPERITARLKRDQQPVYLGDMVLGSIDGCVTSFAIISAAHGAGLSASIVMILGLANIAADGFSMAVSNYQNAQTAREHIDRLRREEAEHIRLVPEGEKEELRQIYARKGLGGEALESLVEAVSSDVEIWISTMLREEHQVSEASAVPLKAALLTFCSFVVFGMLPLIPFALQASLSTATYLASTSIAAVSFFTIGAIKSRVAGLNIVWGGLRVTGIGLIAAGLALSVGWIAAQF